VRGIIRRPTSPWGFECRCGSAAVPTPHSCAKPVRNRWSALVLAGVLASGCVSTTEITEDRVERREWVTVETFQGDSVQLMDPYVKNDSLIGYGIVDKRRDLS